MNTFIPVIDLFAGPGGLGEGFSIFRAPDRSHPFKIVLSIEKESNAHSTLELRAFFREFANSDIPPEYYGYLRGETDKKTLFSRYENQAEKAKKIAWNIELGSGNPSNDEISKRISDVLNHNPTWVLMGGPPCQAYSIVGRSRMKNRRVNFEADLRHFLYREYLRIVAIHKPPIFVMENVKGILSSKINGENIINKILNDLRNPCKALNTVDGWREAHSGLMYHIFSFAKTASDDYKLNPGDYVIKSEKYGIPQKRHRVILFGIRSDILIKPGTLIESDKMHLIDEWIGRLPRLRSGVSKEKDSLELWRSIFKDILKSRWVNDICDSLLRDLLLSTANNIDDSLTLGSRYLYSESIPESLPEGITDSAIRGVCNHKTRSHMRSDLHRYFFASCFAKLNKRSPKLSEFPEELLPNHKNVSSAIQGKMFADRFRVQIADEPSATIMSHISKDGHYYIHPDPTQCRSLTVREAARLQTFPDNYFFEGNQTSQYQQVGNAVPPLLAKQIAGVVFNILQKI